MVGPKTKVQHTKVVQSAILAGPKRTLSSYVPGVGSLKGDIQIGRS